MQIPNYNFVHVDP